MDIRLACSIVQRIKNDSTISTIKSIDTFTVSGSSLKAYIYIYLANNYEAFVAKSKHYLYHCLNILGIQK